MPTKRTEQQYQLNYAWTMPLRLMNLIGNYQLDSLAGFVPESRVEVPAHIVPEHKKTVNIISHLTNMLSPLAQRAVDAKGTDQAQSAIGSTLAAYAYLEQVSEGNLPGQSPYTSIYLRKLPGMLENLQATREKLAEFGREQGIIEFVVLTSPIIRDFLNTAHLNVFNVTEVSEYTENNGQQGYKVVAEQNGVKFMKIFSKENLQTTPRAPGKRRLIKS